VDPGNDHPAGLNVGVERLEVRPASQPQRTLHAKRWPDLVADLLAKLDLNPLGALLERWVSGHEHRRQDVVGILRAAPDNPPDGLTEEQVGPLDGRVGSDPTSPPRR
jgi:hypothetical protein